jgi:hypothetical protein
LFKVIYLQHLLFVGVVGLFEISTGWGVWRLDFGFLMNAEAGKIEAMRLAAIACLLCTVASGQWIRYPTEGVPKGKDGKPNLSAPAPRGSDNKPDFSGMWITGEGLPCPKSLQDETGDCLEKSPLSRFAADLNQAIPGGLPFQPESVKIRKARQEGALDPHVRCLPSNFPRMFTLPHITKFVQTRKLLVLINEYNASYRQIFMDGRPLPVDPQPSWNGYSTAKWEGDTLVVQTNGFRDDLWMDMSGTPLTNAATVTERFRRPNFGTLEIEATVNDPRAYTRPWSMKMIDKIVLDTELIDEVCLENENSARHMKTP